MQDIISFDEAFCLISLQQWFCDFDDPDAVDEPPKRGEIIDHTTYKMCCILECVSIGTESNLDDYF